MAKPSKPADYGVEPDTVLLGKYKINAILGHGGMGIVALATHIQLEEKVAIKFLRDDVTLDEETMRRFLREAQNAVKLKSEHVARVTDVGTFESGTPYMVMEYLEGIDLGQMLQESGKINPSLAVELLLQACVALAEAHSLGIVHRDIKPGNLFVTWRADGSPLLKILDFGISKAPVGADMNLTQTQSLLGTPAYMSPEQMRSARTVDPRSDIWSLGTVLYEIIQGRRPFEAESFSEMCVKVAVDPPAALTVSFPSGLDKVILRALEKDQNERYQTIAEMARDLAPFARDRNSALVAVERMTRMLGRSRASFEREPSSVDALPRGMGRSPKSQPVMVPVGQVGSAPIKSKASDKGTADTGNLSVGDVTDHDMTLDTGEATAITTLEAARRRPGDSVAPPPVNLEDTGPDTDQRDRVQPPDSQTHATIEDDLSWHDGKSPWTPQSTTAQNASTTDPSVPVAPAPAVSRAQRDANAAASKAVHAAAEGLAVKKALKPQTGAQLPRSGSGTIPQGSAGSGSSPKIDSRPTPAPASTASAPAAVPGSPGNPLAATLPGLFPLVLPNRPRPTPVHGVSAVGSAPSMLRNPPVAARQTAPAPNLRPSRAKLLVLVLGLGIGIGFAVFAATSNDNDAVAPVAPPVEPPAITPPAPPPTPPVHELAPTTTTPPPAPSTGTPTTTTPPTPGATGAIEPDRPGATVEKTGGKTGAGDRTATVETGKSDTGKSGGKTGGNKTGGNRPGTDIKAGTKPGTAVKTGTTPGTTIKLGTGAGSSARPPTPPPATSGDPFAKRVPEKKPR